MSINTIVTMSINTIVTVSINTIVTMSINTAAVGGCDDRGRDQGCACVLRHGGSRPATRTGALDPTLLAVCAG
jgi:hypothetical protein